MPKKKFLAAAQLASRGRIFSSAKYLAAAGLAAYSLLIAPAASAQDADFQARCTAPGVLKCYGFNNATTDVVRNTTLFKAGDGQFHGDLDTTVKASGAGSLRFDLEPPPRTTGANISGSWVPAGGWGTTFSENSHFYVQYRIRLSDYMVQSGNFGNAIWKTSIFHMGQSTCNEIELTTSGYYGSGLAQFDTSCGARWFWTNLAGTSYVSTPPLLMQQTDDLRCEYNFHNDPGNGRCVFFKANEWMTLYYDIQIGTWGQANTRVKAYLAGEGQAMKKFIDISNMILNCNSGNCGSAPGKLEGYNNVTLTPYMTGLSNSAGPTTTAHMWFDEFILSTQPIAPPGGAPAVRPSPPTSVRVN